MPGWAIILIAVAVILLADLLFVKLRHGSVLYKPVTPHGEQADNTEGTWRELIQKRNRVWTRRGWIVAIAVLIFGCVLVNAAPRAGAVQAALWPSATPTASLTPTASPTRTLKPTLAVTLTPRASTTPKATQTTLATQTARIIYQGGGQSVVTQIVNVERTVVVQRTVLVPMTVIVFQTVVVMPTETPTASATASETPTETATESPTPTETATP